MGISIQKLDKIISRLVEYRDFVRVAKDIPGLPDSQRNNLRDSVRTRVISLSTALSSLQLEDSEDNDLV
jgi:hypothetical protein